MKGLFKFTLFKNTVIGYHYLTEVSKTRQCRILPPLLVNRTFPVGFPQPCIIQYKDAFLSPQQLL